MKVGHSEAIIYDQEISTAILGIFLVTFLMGFAFCDLLLSEDQ